MNLVCSRMISLLSLFALLLSSSGCYTQLAVSEEDETTVTEIVVLYPLFPPIPPPPLPCCSGEVEQYPTSAPPLKVDSPKRDFGTHRSDNGGAGDDRRTRRPGGRDR